MAAKPEDPTAAPTEDAGLLGGAGLEKQPEPDLVAGPEAAKIESNVDDTTAGVAELSMGEKKDEEERKTEEAPTAAPTTDTSATHPTTTNTVTPTQGPVWPETAPDHPLTKFYACFEALCTEASHNEVYGITLSPSNPFHTKLILQKFLRANQNDLEKAKQQLLDTLKWRKEFDPIKAAAESYDKAKFGGLGYVLELSGVPESSNEKDVATFNIYGAVKDNKKTFGDLDTYVSLFPPLFFHIHIYNILPKQFILTTKKKTDSSAGASASWKNQSKPSPSPPPPPLFQTTTQDRTPTKASKSTTTSKSPSSAATPSSKPLPIKRLRFSAATTPRRLVASFSSMCRLLWAGCLMRSVWSWRRRRGGSLPC
jgi:hypothetical protein